MGHLLLRLARKCASLDIAVAFLSREGYEILEPTLRGLLVRESPVRMVVGLSNLLRITDEKAVGNLVDLSGETRPRRGSNPLLQLRYYNNAGFHPKIFIFHRSAKEIDVVVGSSNLTKGGQLSNTEANVLLVSPDSDFVSSVKDFYERVWENADELAETKLEKYKGRKRNTAERTSGKRGSLPVTKLPPPSSSFNIGLPDKIPDIKTWWKIAPGTKGEAWSEVWYPNIDDKGVGVAAIGWEEVGDLSGFQKTLQRNDLAPLRSAVLETARRIGWKTKRLPHRPIWKVPRAVDYATETLASFTGWWREKNPLRVGQGLIAYSNRSVYGIGQIKGDYNYDEGLPWQNHCREVKWFRVKRSPPKAPPRLIRELGVGKWQTITPIDSSEIIRVALKLPQWNSP